jgi:cell division protein FtsB
MVFDFFLFYSTTIETLVKNNKETSQLAYMQIRAAFLTIVVLVLTVLLIFSFSNAKTAYAHVTKNFGNIQVEVGWTTEPPLVGELNNVIIQVNQTSGKNSQTPVINALGNMDIAVKYGGLTKPLDFVPSEETEGMYNGQMIPTRIGSYSLVLNGTIQNQKINAEIPLDLVESTQKLNFPDSGGASSGGIGVSNTAATSNNIGPQLQGIVSQLANDIDLTKNSLDTLSKTNTNTQKTIQDLKSTNDRLYMIGTGAIGAGVAGIVIAAVALSRREVMKIS